MADYYVDDERTSNGSGTAASPWKLRSDISWSTITTALGSGPVNLYFSSRAAWTNTSYLTIPTNTNTTSNRLTIDGMSKYNTVASGDASWQTETVSTNKAYLDQTVIIDRDVNQFITLRGFNIVGAASGGIALGQGATLDPVFNIHDIIIEDCIVDTPTSNAGISMVFGETGCYNIIVRRNTIIESPAEGIYIGHFNYIPDTITGVIVEYNTLIDTGADASGQGDIDIKPGVYGAIVRYNTIYHTTLGHVHAGVVMGASAGQVYGNEVYNLAAGIWDGEGITVNADGAKLSVVSITRSGTTATVTTLAAHTLVTGESMRIEDAVQSDYNITATVTVTGTTTFTYTVSNSPTTPATGTILAHIGKNLVNNLVYNNLIYGNYGNGVSAFSTAPRSSIAGLKVLNNTVLEQTNGHGLHASASGTGTIALTLTNNIFSENSTYEVWTSSSAVTLTSSNYNCFYHPASSSLFYYQGVAKTWTQWQALGFDANGVNADPALLASYRPNAGSPVIGAGATLSDFSVDFNEEARTAPWDIGAIRYYAAPRPVIVIG